ncbi:MAG: recombinase family protein [Polyangiaceae bacterium]
MTAAPFIITAAAEVTTVAIYLRVSTADQNEANQRPDVDRLVAARFPGAHLVLYAERRSAAKERPEFDRMMRDARARRFQALVVWAIDRFGRSMTGNLSDIVDLDKAGVQVVSCRESWLDTRSPVRDLLIAIFSWAAQQERERIRERIGAGLKRARENGGATWRPGFGLRIVRDEQTGLAHFTLNDELRPTLLRIAEVFLACGSLRGTALRLQAEGAPPPSKGGTWGHVAVRRALTHEQIRELGAWPSGTLTKIDASLKALERPTPRGAAAPKHLASSFVACGVCLGCLTVCKGTKNSGYLCSRYNAKRSAGCVGIGQRSETQVDRALVALARRAVTGDIMERAMQIVRERLAAQPDIATERDAVAHALTEAKRQGEALAAAIKKGGELDALVDAAKENDKQVKQLRARVARLDAAPPSLDKRRRLGRIEEKLAEMAKALDEGGLAARPVLAAILQGRRMRAIPIVLDGQRRWQLTCRLPTGYLASIDGTEGSASTPSCRAQCESLRASRQPPPWPRPSAAPASSDATRSPRARQARCRRRPSRTSPAHP